MSSIRIRRARGESSSDDARAAVRQRATLGRQSGRAAGPIDGDECRMRRGEAGSCLGMRDHVVEGHGARPHAHERGLDAYRVVEACRREVANGRLGDGKPIALRLEIGIATAQCAHELDAADLAPHEIVGVVHDAHTVRLGVTDAQLGRVRQRHSHPRPMREYAARRRPREDRLCARVATSRLTACSPHPPT